MVKIAVVTVSDRVSRGEREDASGPLAASLLSAYGEVVRTDVVPDGVDTVRAAISGAADAGVNVVFTTGGTGVTGRDQTPEATEALIEQRMFGIENLLRSNPNVPQAALSRGLAGVGRGLERVEPVAGRAHAVAQAGVDFLHLHHQRWRDRVQPALDALLDLLSGDAVLAEGVDHLLDRIR